jgi:hypothetical protein
MWNSNQEKLEMVPKYVDCRIFGRECGIVVRKAQPTQSINFLLKSKKVIVNITIHIITVWLHWRSLKCEGISVTDLPFYVLFRLFVGRQWT